MSGYKLYTFYKSSTAWRARIALNLKQIKPEYVFVNLLKSEQRSDEYRKINPHTVVPSLVLPNGTVLIQTAAIIQYLNEIKPEPYNLFPGEPEKRALIRGFCEVINSGIHPYQNLRVLEKLNEEYGVDKIQWCRHWTSKGIQTVQNLITKLNKSGKYVFGDQITAADIFLYPQISVTIQRWGLDLKQLPNITRVFQNLKKVKQFRDADPQNQPDHE